METKVLESGEELFMPSLEDLQNVRNTQHITRLKDPNHIKCHISNVVGLIDQVLKGYSSKQKSVSSTDYNDDMRNIKELIYDIKQYDDEYYKMIDSLLNDVLKKHNITMNDILFKPYGDAGFDDFLKKNFME